MKHEGAHSNTLVFKVSESGQISDLNASSKVINFIADMQDLSLEAIELVKNNLIIFGQSIYEKKGSFVIVCKYVFDESLNIVPTLQEAFDFVEMEEIERQLDL